MTQLTQEQKQKYLEYVEKKRLTQEKRQALTTQSLAPKPSSNLFVILTDDFFGQIEQLEMFKKYSTEQQENFKGNIVNEIFEAALTGILQDVKNLDESADNGYEISNLLMGADSPDSFFYILDGVIKNIPGISDRFSEHLIIKYLDLCKEFKLKPTSEIAPIINQIDKQ